MEYMISCASQLRLHNSDSVALACLRSGRRFIGFEKDPAYFETARDRIAEYLAAHPREVPFE